ncbi:MAG: hypothetical protein MJ067_00350 [Oscillospiraceae bacterium]|nr:hypothetical protein [Oscillospiraceae bacterium]
MHEINLEIKLTGSKLFDIVMYNTATELCTKYPGLTFEYDKERITIHGELNDYWYQKYQEAMFYNELGK